MNDEKHSIVIIDTAKPSVTPLANCGVASDLCHQIVTHVVTACGFSPNDQYAFNFTTDPNSGNVTVVSNLNTQVQNSTAVTANAQLVGALYTVLVETKVGSTESTWQRLRDYAEGVAQSINPLPVDTEELFFDSDRAAMHSDSLSVQSDISAVCDAALRARKALESRFHGRQESRRESDQASVRERAKAS